jgi:molybdenum cofactor biosynthesis enzyme MoaA
LRAGASDAELLELLRSAWSQRADRYSEMRSELRGSEAPLRKVEMHYIGG